VGKAAKPARTGKYASLLRMCTFLGVSETFYRQMPRKPRLAGGDESAQFKNNYFSCLPMVLS
jgi:hypothetical protein